MQERKDLTQPYDTNLYTNWKFIKCKATTQSQLGLEFKILWFLIFCTGISFPIIIIFSTYQEIKDTKS